MVVQLLIRQDAYQHICHLPVFRLVYLISNSSPLFITHQGRGYFVGFVCLVLVAIVERCVIRRSHHRHCTHDDSHGATTQPYIYMVAQARHVSPRIIRMTCQRIKQRALVFFQHLTGDTVITSCFQQVAVLLVPLLRANIGKRACHLAQTYFLKCFRKTFFQNFSARQKLSYHFRAVLPCLRAFYLCQSWQQLLLVHHMVATFIVSNHMTARGSTQLTNGLANSCGVRNG